MSLYIHFHIWAEMTVGMAHGMSIAARTTPRPFHWAFTTSAIASPRTSSRVTVSAVKSTVTPTASRK
jgi:hypothetical protein